MRSWGRRAGGRSAFHGLPSRRSASRPCRPSSLPASCDLERQYRAARWMRDVATSGFTKGLQRLYERMTQEGNAGTRPPCAIGREHAGRREAFAPLRTHSFRHARSGRPATYTERTAKGAVRAIIRRRGSQTPPKQSTSSISARWREGPTPSKASMSSL